MNPPHSVHWHSLIQRRTAGNKHQFTDMHRSFEVAGVKPIVDKVFEFDQLKEAYEYLQAAKHIGKVVVRVA